ncbi:MAG: hypothetical protein ACI9YM_001943 [Brevundimonas sp.]|jgi:hypothetical protein|uniref:gpW family head-tail joining protein n=1 Tax=Brevundimonas sp. TaxID=1871086 RepID=UPI0039E2D807
MATLAERLTEAEAALHKLLTGAAAVEVQDASGDRVRFAKADRASLAAYVSDLRRQLAGSSRPTTIRFNTSKGI